MISRPILATILAVVLATSAGALDIYQIGNSLTWDSQPDRTEMIAEIAGESLFAGRHIRCNSTLNEIWSNPTSTCVDPAPSLFGDALVNEAWDAVTLQPYGKGVSTMGQDLARIDDFLGLANQNPANASTRYYVYAAFPLSGNWDQWDDPFADDLSELTVHTAGYYDALLGRLETQYPGDFGIVPIGHALNRMRAAIEEGDVPGVSSIAQLYRDPIHLSQAGRFFASTTVYATMFGQSPIGLPVPRGSGGWSQNDLSDELALVMQEVVWDVVSTLPAAGVVTGIAGDYDADGSIGLGDYRAWRNTYGSPYLRRADGNGDGVIDAADYTILRDAEFPQAIATPEPGAGLLAAAAASVALLRRRV